MRLVLLALVLLAGCGGGDKELLPAEWILKYGAPDLHAFNADVDSATRGVKDPAVAKIACDRMTADVKSAKNHPSPPDAEARHLWSTALDEYDLAAKSICEGNMRAALPHIEAATKSITQTTDRMEALSPP